MRVLLIGLFLLTGPVFGQRISSYVNEDGVKVFTNEPIHRPSAPSRLVRPRSADQDRGAFFRPVIQEVSKSYGIDEDLVEAIVAVESNFDPLAVSSKNCKGLMQLHPDTAARFGVRDIFDPQENVEGGVRYLSFLLDEFDDNLELALAAYNAGENAVRRYDDIPPYPETVDYVKKVASLYDFSIWEGSDVAETKAARRVYRVALPDGRLLFTNTPTDFGR